MHLIWHSTSTRTSYLSEIGTKSRIAGQYFLGSVPQKDKPIALNGATFVFCGILMIVVASAAEVELGAFFLNCKEGKILRSTLENGPPATSHTSTFRQPRNHWYSKRHCQETALKIDGNVILLGGRSSQDGMCSGTQARRTLPIISPSIAMEYTIKR